MTQEFKTPHKLAYATLQNEASVGAAGQAARGSASGSHRGARSSPGCSAPRCPLLTHLAKQQRMVRVLGHCHPHGRPSRTEFLNSSFSLAARDI